MKNKGFTLVELLATMVLLILVFLIIFPAITNILSKSKETIYQKQINAIINAAYDFTLKNVSFLPENNKKTYLTLGNLKSNGLVDVNIMNPNENIKFEDDIVISINNVGANYKYSNKNSKLEGNYLYTVEIDKNYSQDLLPKIFLQRKNDSNSATDLNPNEDGNYIIILELNETFIDNFTSKSKDNINLTDKVSRYITNDDKMVEFIDTSKPNIYKINYSVVDNEGYSNSVVLNIIIDDNQKPKIYFATDDLTLAVGVTSYDLLSDVICEDNSGFCDITYSGNVDYNVIGKYIIRYKGTDPSGNVVEKERIVRIK